MQAIKEIKQSELNTDSFIKEKAQEISNLVGDGFAINALSGGVDSNALH